MHYMTHLALRCAFGLGFVLQSEKAAPSIPGAWVADSIPGWGMCGRQPVDVSLPLFLPPSPSVKIYHILLKKKMTHLLEQSKLHPLLLIIIDLES